MTGGYILARVANIVVKLQGTIFLNRAKSAALSDQKCSTLLLFQRRLFRVPVLHVTCGRRESCSYS